MSANLPVINRWQSEGWEWLHVFYPTQRAFVIPANGQVQIPSEKYVFKYEEGVLLAVSYFFDNPYCGVRFHWGPEFDTKDKFTVNGLIVSTSASDQLVYALMPPDSPYYTIRIPSAWKWEKWLEMYLINTDSEDHYCLGYGYIIAGTNKQQKIIEKLTAEKLLLYSQLYPEIVVDLKKKMRNQAEAEMETLGISLKA